MKVNITLYKTNFDEENIFVSSSKESRESAIDNFFSSEDKLVISNSSFNLEHPFRIAKNFFDLDKKYNYAKYEYYNGDEKKDTRFYFIRNFKYLNDNQTEMVVAEDTVGEHFHDLRIKHFLPQRFTFRENQISNRIYQPQNINQTFELKNKLDLLKKINIGDKEYLVGFIVVSATNGNAFTYEEGLQYSIQTYLTPFFIDLDLDVSANLLFDIHLKIGNEIFSLDSAFSYYKFSKISDGFSFVSNFMLTEWFNWFDIEIVSNGLNDTSITFKPTSNNISVTHKQFTIPSEGSLNVIQLIAFSEGMNELSIDLNEYSNIKNNIYSINEYKKISINCDGEYLDLNPTIINNNSIVRIKQSIIPPYNLSLYFETDFVSKKYIKIQRNNQILHIDDGYTEWLKQNKNAQITGLKVQQYYDRNIMNNTLIGNASKTFVNSLSSMATGVSKSFLTGNILSSVGDMSKALSGAIGMGIDSIVTSSNFNENVAKQNALLDLSIMDLQNSIDKVSVGDNLGEYIRDELFFNIKFFDVIQLNLIIKNHKMFGFTYCKDINNIINHTKFDYAQGKDIVLEFINGFSPNESERNSIEKYFENGIRYWYDINYYKNFDIENQEIQEV